MTEPKAGMTPEQREKARATGKSHYEAHKDAYKARAKARYEGRKDAAAAYGKAYYEAHKVAVAASGKKYREAHKAEIRAGKRASNNRRRAALRGCELASNVSAKTYARIMAGDPSCTYCPAPATHVDHVYPFYQGGPESDDNLVPACATCNSGKRAKLLTEWAWARVEYGAARSPKVAAELARLMDEDVAA
jgi:5-methylcytosine-specific restriction endonuclease McrA